MQRFNQAHIHDHKFDRTLPKEIPIYPCEQDKAVDIYECALEANELNLLDAQEFKERQRLQAKAMTYCKELLFFIELSHEQGFISTNSCEYWSKLALDVKYMLAAWKKRDRARG